MGRVTEFSVVEGPEAWTAADYQDQSKYIHVLTESDIAELDSAVAAVQERGLDIKVGRMSLLASQPAGSILNSFPFRLDNVLACCYPDRPECDISGRLAGHAGRLTGKCHAFPALS